MSTNHNLSKKYPYFDDTKINYEKSIYYITIRYSKNLTLVTNS